MKPYFEHIYNNDVTPPALWDTLKATLIAISSYEKKMKQ